MQEERLAEGEEKEMKYGVTPIVWTVMEAQVRAPVFGVFVFRCFPLQNGFRISSINDDLVPGG